MPIPRITDHIRFRPLWIAAVLITATATPARAQILVWPPEEPQSLSEPGGAASNGEDLVKVLQIDAAPEPDPALRYRFWPIAGDRTSGNAMMVLQRATGMLLEQGAHRSTDAFYENYEQWMSGPLDELPRDAIREYLRSRAPILAEIHRASAMKDSGYDIGLENLRGPTVTQFQLNEFQNARNLARLLQLQIRLALAEQRYEDAVGYLRSGFRMADTIGHASDLLIGRLVGIAIGGMMLGSVQEMIALPESPNLYWALASLPHSIWEVQKAIEYESHLSDRLLPSLSDLPSHLSDAGWRERLVEVTESFLRVAASPDQDSATGDDHQLEIQARLTAGAMVAVLDGAARNYLQRIGSAPEAAQAMSPSEVMLRATDERLQRITDELFKWTLLPRPISAGYPDDENAVLQPGGSMPDPAQVIAGMLMPAIRASQAAAERNLQSVAFLATVEALRMHVAEHGRFPESLENLQPVPALRDPATGELFEYQRISDTVARLAHEPAYTRQPDATLRLELRN